MKRALVLVALLLAGCSTPPRKAPEVASLTTPGSGSPSSSAAPAQEQRPRLRLDMSPEDTDALYQVLVRCMVEHGVDKTRFQAEGVPSHEVIKAADKACEKHVPLPLWERDRNNPEAIDFAHRIMECLRDKGEIEVAIAEFPDSPTVDISFGGPNPAPDSIGKSMENMATCEKEAAKK